MSAKFPRGGGGGGGGSRTFFSSKSTLSVAVGYTKTSTRGSLAAAKFYVPVHPFLTVYEMNRTLLTVCDCMFSLNK